MTIDDDKSKSQKKREAEALQKLGEALTKLRPAQLAEIPLPEALADALEQEKKITSHGAKKRHLQFIGRIMREIEDIESIQKAYSQLMEKPAKDSAHFRLCEQWRTRLITEGNETLTEFINQYPCDDIQRLRQLIRDAIQDKQQNKDRGAAKHLFRFINDVIP